MRVVQLPTVEGALLYFLDRFPDARGAFTEIWRASQSRVGEDECFEPAQLSVSSSHAGVLRGMHGQTNTAKLVTCVYGRICDVIVDTRPTSPTRGAWLAEELTPGRALYVPANCLHGFYAIEDSVVTYMQDREYVESEQFRGHWACYGIPWPLNGFAPWLSHKDR